MPKHLPDINHMLQFKLGQLMHKKSYAIIKNLGYDDEVVKEFKIDAKDADPKVLNAKLKKMGLPETAIKQIKSLEDLQKEVKPTKVPNKLLVDELHKKGRRSIDAFAQKNIEARIIFKNGTWTIFSEEYSKPIQKFHEACKLLFDELAFKNLEATIVFDGSTTWRLIVPNDAAPTDNG